MALVLEAEQNSLIAQAGLTIITLVKLTTYADTLSKSVPVRHYFSDKPVIYDYDNLGTDREFWPVVASFSDFTRSFQHVPSADDMRPYRDSLRVNFSNQEFQGRRLINLLRDENLLGADIELSEIAVPSMDSYPVDLTAKTGTEHTVHFAGYIRTVDDVSQSVFTLSCEVRMPSNDLIWGLSRLAAGAAASAARPARRYKNVRLPIGYGYDAGWESVMVHGGGEGRLNGDISDSYVGQFSVDNIEDFNTSGDDFDVRIDQETMVVAYDSGTGKLDINDGGRGTLGTAAAAHSAGTIVTELPGADNNDAKWVVQNHRSIGDTTTWAVTVSKTVGSREVWTAIIPGSSEFNAVPGLLLQDFERTPTELLTLLESIEVIDPTGAVGDDHPQLWCTNIDDGTRFTTTQIAWGSRFQQGAAVTVLDTFDATHADWDGAANCTTSSDTDDYVEGTGSVVAESVSGQSEMDFEKDYAPAIDLTGMAISFSAKWTQEAFDAATFGDYQKWAVRFESTSGVAAWNVWFELDMVEPGVWQRWYAKVEGGSLDPSDITQIRFRHEWQTTLTGQDVSYDNLTYATEEHHYDIAVADDLLQPTDIMSHWIEAMGREDIDEASRAINHAATAANLLSGDVRPLGFLWEEVAQALALRCRANLIPEWVDGRRIWKLLGADANYKFAKPSLYISEYATCDDIGMDVEEVGTNFTFKYHRLPLYPDAGDEGFGRFLVANPAQSDVDTVTASDLQATRAKIGNREYPPIKYLLIDDDDTMKDLAGYTVQESSDPDRCVFQITDVPWYLGYEVQLGDIVEITPPWLNLGEPELIETLANQEGDWDAVDNGTPFNNGSIFRNDGGSLRARSDDVGPDIGIKNEGNVRVLNMRDRAFSVYVYPNAATHATLVEVILRIASGADVDTDYKEWTFPVAGIVADGWTQLRAQLDGSESGSSGTLDPTHVRHHQFYWEQDPLASLRNVIYDEWKIENQRIPVRIISTTKKYGSQHFDFTAVQVETV